ncbi:MAG: hypothetical protein ACLR2E_22430 [Lachnospiraceae bacterium]
MSEILFWMAEPARSGTTGRKPNQLYIRRNSHFVVVFNWYENRIYTHLVDIAGTSVFQEACELKQGEAYVSASRNCFQNSVLQHCAPDEILGICVVIAAMIDENTGKFTPPPSAFPLWKLPRSWILLRKPFRIIR